MTATTAPKRYIRCGHCQDYHGSIAETRECARSRFAASAQEATVPAPRVNVPAEEGMYRKGDVIYKVQIAVHGNGRPYAKQLVQDGENWSFEYAPGAVRTLRPEHRLTLEQAKEFGALYGTCCVCGRTLTNESSIEAGIGPVCASKF